MDPSNNVARYDDPYRHYQEPWNNSHVPGLHLYAPQASYTSVNTSVTAVDSVFNDGNRTPRDVTRTPSPTPSEAKQLNGDGLLGGEDVENWRFWIRREWLWYYVALGVIVILIALLLIFHTQIVDWLTPFSQWLHEFVFLFRGSVWQNMFLMTIGRKQSSAN